MFTLCSVPLRGLEKLFQLLKLHPLCQAAGSIQGRLCPKQMSALQSVGCVKQATLLANCACLLHTLQQKHEPPLELLVAQHITGASSLC